MQCNGLIHQPNCRVIGDVPTQKRDNVGFEGVGADTLSGYAIHDKLAKFVSGAAIVKPIGCSDKRNNALHIQEPRLKPAKNATVPTDISDNTTVGVEMVAGNLI
jgi:hypothetical protein